MTSGWNGDTSGGNRPKGFTQIGARMNDPIIDSLKQYWEKLRAGRVAPYRSEIDPRQFEHALENVFILEIIGDKNIRVRLAGMRLCEMMGMEVRGMSPRAFMMPDDRDRFDDAILDVVNNTSVIEFTLETVDFHGRTSTAYLLLMPLRSDFGEITRILGCISDTGEPYEAPVRFRITQKKHDRIEFSDLADRMAESGFAEPTKTFETEVKPQPKLSTITGGAENTGTLERTRKRGHLRLISNDE